MMMKFYVSLDSLKASDLENLSIIMRRSYWQKKAEKIS